MLTPKTPSSSQLDISITLLCTMHNSVTYSYGKV